MVNIYERKLLRHRSKTKQFYKTAWREVHQCECLRTNFFESFGACAQENARTMLLGPLSSVKVKEKGEEIMYLYGERNLKEKLKSLIFDI